jgi:hypothetical protein
VLHPAGLLSASVGWTHKPKIFKGGLDEVVLFSFSAPFLNARDGIVVRRSGKLSSEVTNEKSQTE